MNKDNDTPPRMDREIMQRIGVVILFLVTVTASAFYGFRVGHKKGYMLALEQVKSMIGGR